MSSNKPSVLFLMPTFGSQPIGGYKIIFEYANRLASDGYRVSIAYAGIILKNFLRKSFKEKIKTVKLLIRGFHGKTARIWFPLNNSIVELFPLTLNYSQELKADIYIATACLTAKYAASYPQGKKYYFIQGYETWDMSEKELDQTYSLPLKKIVVSNWLHDLLTSRGYDSTIIKNGFDFNEFHLTVPIEEKMPRSISVMYHQAPVKGFQTALKALDMVRARYDISVTAFGMKLEEPLPTWIKFVETPSPEEHLRINNQSSIYLTASFSEGWGLTIGEAMMCGQAVVCTATKGFLEMAVNQRNALISPIGDHEALAQSLIALIEDDELRQRIARQGLEDIKRFNLEESYYQFKKMIAE